MTINASLACNLDNDILSAAYPLLAQGKVAGLEWSFDALYQHQNVPDWFYQLLQAYSEEGRLIGHGIFFSIFSGKWQREQQDWLNTLKKTAKEFTFDHVTEHFGFMTGANFHHGAPISVPFNQSTLNIGRDRLWRIQDVCNCPVGLENLAFAYSLDEVKKQGIFLDELTEPMNGFIILDLHNLYCQLHNFEIAFEDLIKLYPLHKVREMHVSGGSWENSALQPVRKIRRDTHDDSVPEEVFSLLEKTIVLCPQLKFVVLEQLGIGLKNEEQRNAYYRDFMRMEKIVQAAGSAKDATNSFLPQQTPLTDVPPQESYTLQEQQLQLSSILEHASDATEAIRLLQNSNLANTDWQVEQWSPYMIETAINIAQKWKKSL